MVKSIKGKLDIIIVILLLLQLSSCLREEKMTYSLEWDNPTEAQISIIKESFQNWTDVTGVSAHLVPNEGRIKVFDVQEVSGEDKLGRAYSTVNLWCTIYCTYYLNVGKIKVLRSNWTDFNREKNIRIFNHEIAHLYIKDSKHSDNPRSTLYSNVVWSVQYIDIKTNRVSK